ncbi:MAG TPA: dephospho-CoA kinase [Candidatus Omnitrophota bacterium]|nr:dephospho-CoA kinase [Candidatus Omnitrophota bacterium]
MTVIGLTGSLGTGKSTVARMFKALGAHVLDADQIARQLMRPGAPCFMRIVKMFGKDIIASGRIDRKKLASRVFADARQRRRLEQIIHPKVRKIIVKKIREGKRDKSRRVIVIDVPLLFEAKLNRCVDHTIVVTAGRAEQIARAARNLGITKAEAKRRIKAQMPLRQKIRLADITIDNHGTFNQTQKQVKQIWERL